jgi:predicted HTH transcriptional regulator
VVQLTDGDILRRLIAGDVSADGAVPALHDRQSGQFRPAEGQLLDYKEVIRLDEKASVAELARDILGFSNSEGGLLIIGVADDRRVLGHDSVDFRGLRNALGVFVGTRVDFDLEEVIATISGHVYRFIAVVARRSQTPYPNLLRKDIELFPRFVRKVKYIKGTLFYRRGAETLSESPYSDEIESRARELGFSEAAPRTRTSLVLQED